MNKNNVLAVADGIEGRGIRGLGFNMRVVLDEAPEYVAHNHFETECRTLGCIAGWSYVVGKGLERPRATDSNKVWRFASEWLGLNPDEANDLFCPHSLLGKFNQITPKQAVAVLRHLAETGKVDWSVASAATP